MLCVRTIAITNQKGGVGKTTTTANLGAALAGNGKNVCLIDFDPQAHLTIHFGIDPTTIRSGIYDVLTADTPLRSAAVSVEPNLSVIPSVIDLAAAEVELARTVGREQILRDRITEETLPYDFIMIDCPPSLGLLTLNALSAAGEVLIPLQPHFLALQGLGQLLETVSLVRRRINPDLKVAGVIFCMFETGTRLSGEVVEDVREFFTSARSDDAPWSKTHIFKTRIRRNIKLAECPSHGATIHNYDPSSHGAEDYAALADEFLTTFAANAGSDSHEQTCRDSLSEAQTLVDLADNKYAGEPIESPSVQSPEATQ
ncbi:MAG: ParA family protein [Planctomycetota bacterium]|nr:ParA family protein [Planctomycetota bacterium]